MVRSLPDGDPCPHVEQLSLAELQVDNNIRRYPGRDIGRVRRDYQRIDQIHAGAGGERRRCSANECIARCVLDAGNLHSISHIRI